jgi:hypothetical protein
VKKYLPKSALLMVAFALMSVSSASFRCAVWNSRARRIVDFVFDFGDVARNFAGRRVVAEKGNFDLPRTKRRESIKSPCVPALRR